MLRLCFFPSPVKISGYSPGSECWKSAERCWRRCSKHENGKWTLL